MRFTALLHHLTVGLLKEGFCALKRRAAPGVDGVTWEEYEPGLEGRLVDLHSRVHRGAYRAQPSRRVYIPKPDGRQRPLGVAALEDKIVQHAVLTILNQIYEEDFRGFSYGFRPGRSQHQALDALYVAITRKKVSFGRFAEQDRKRRGEGKPETFDFLGFTHISGKDPNGNFAVKRHTIGKRLRGKLAEIKQQLRERMHEPVAATGKWLKSVVQGYFNYHAVPGNTDILRVFHYRVTRLWRQVLIRRGQRGYLNWVRMRRLEERWIPMPRVLHPYPRSSL